MKKIIISSFSILAIVAIVFTSLNGSRINTETKGTNSSSQSSSSQNYDLNDNIEEKNDSLESSTSQLEQSTEKNINSNNTNHNKQNNEDINHRDNNKIDKPSSNTTSSSNTSSKNPHSSSSTITPPSSNRPSSSRPSSRPTPPSSSKPSTPSSNYSDFQAKVVELVNIERQKAGISALKMNTSLNNVATIKSKDMADNNYFDHNSPTYGSPFDMLKQFGISYKAAGENIAMGQKTPEQVMQGWMNSEGHRKNILNGSFTQIGVGIAVNSKGQLYWTQQFIG